MAVLYHCIMANIAVQSAICSTVQYNVEPRLVDREGVQIGRACKFRGVQIYGLHCT
jgi:hypothetical protein